MLFNSIEFLLFLPLVFSLYWFVFKNKKSQNLFLVVASYVFYGWWDWRFLFLIAFTSLCSYGSGVLWERYEGNRKKQKVISAANISLNLLILGIFKYFNFFVESFEELLGTFGIHVDWVTINIILPVGISFYTFQALSYTIDIYQKKIMPTHDPIEFFAYISFFPQLVAGPIERAARLLPQFQKLRSFDYAQAADGCRQMLWGFFKKMVIADNCGGLVTQIWAGYDSETGLVLLLGAILFSIQIYCDFSGYSDIAIGCAKLFGIELMRNFSYPYFSRSIPEFWRRWHISLTTWFRDYVYFPLGGSRCDKWKAIRNVYIVWAISGLWHGANWTFVVWGLYHGTLLAIYNIFGINTKFDQVVAYGKLFPSIKEFAQVVLTLFLAVIGWAIFRSESLSESYYFLVGMFNLSLFDLIGSYKCLLHLEGFMLAMYILVPSISILFISEWLQRDRQHALQFSKSSFVGRHIVVRYCVYVGLLLLITGFSVSKAEFIYFRF